MEGIHSIFHQKVEMGGIHSIFHERVEMEGIFEQKIPLRGKSDGMKVFCKTNFFIEKMTNFL